MTYLTPARIGYVSLPCQRKRAQSGPVVDYILTGPVLPVLAALASLGRPDWPRLAMEFFTELFVVCSGSARLFLFILKTR